MRRVRSGEQKENFCLPKVLFLFIQATGLAYHRRAKCSVYHQWRLAALVSHQPLWGWISLRLDDMQALWLDDIQHSVLMIYSSLRN